MYSINVIYFDLHFRNLPKKKETFPKIKQELAIFVHGPQMCIITADIYCNKIETNYMYFVT